MYLSVSSMRIINFNANNPKTVHLAISQCFSSAVSEESNIKMHHKSNLCSLCDSFPERKIHDLITICLHLHLERQQPHEHGKKSGFGMHFCRHDEVIVEKQLTISMQIKKCEHFATALLYSVYSGA